MKLFTLKKSAAAVAAALLLFSAAVGAMSGGIASAQAVNSPVVVIDAGHGGIDVGVCGKTTGIKESDINLSVANYLRSYFIGAGFTAILTRKSQAGLYGLPTKGFKTRDMQRRREIIERSDADMVISVHQNFYSDSSCRGAHVFFRRDSESGKQLAVLIQQALNSLEGGEADNSALTGDYYMLDCTESPSVIVECGFLSNAEDEALLSDDSYRKSVAYAIFSAAISWFA